MNVDVSSHILIDRPRSEVAAFAADPGNAPKWYANIKTVTWETPPPLSVGSRVSFRAEFLGRRLAYTYQVVDYVEGARLAMATQQGPFPMETTYLWEDAGKGRTHMTLRNRGRPAGFSRIWAPLMGMAVRRANRKDLRLLKSILEARTPGTNS